MHTISIALLAAVRAVAAGIPTSIRHSANCCSAVLPPTTSHRASATSFASLRWDIRIARSPQPSISATKTVKTHVANLLGKLGVENRAQAIVQAFKRGLVSLDDLG